MSFHTPQDPFAKGSRVNKNVFVSHRDPSFFFSLYNPSVAQKKNLNIYRGVEPWANYRPKLHAGIRSPEMT